MMSGVYSDYPREQVAISSVFYGRPPFPCFLQAVGEKWPAIMGICPMPLQGSSLPRY